MSDPFDRWLEDELGAGLSRAAGPADAAPVPCYRSAGRRSATWSRLSLLSGVPLALSVKTVAALAAAALATGGAAAIVVSQHSGGWHGTQPGLVHSSSSSSGSAAGSGSGGAAATGHGGTVTDAVASCQAARPTPDASPGSRGIGDCVSPVAGNRGQGHTPDPQGSGAARPGAPGESADHPTPAVSHPTPDAGHPTPAATQPPAGADHPTPDAGHPTPNPHAAGRPQ